MGKRELLLIVCFVIVGVVVYQATAPPSRPNEKGFSFSRIMEAARREIRGNRAVAETTTTSTQPVTPELTEIRILGTIAELDIAGEDRRDIATSLRVHSNAYNDAEAKKYADQTVLKTDLAAGSLVYRVKYPEGRQTGRQRAFLTLKVPSRLRIRVESRPGKLAINNVSGVEAGNGGGEATIRNVAGRVALTHRGGRILIEDATTLKFTGRGIELTVKHIREDASITMEQGGELTASHLGGPLDIESRNADVRLEDMEGTRGPIRVNAVGGSVRLTGVKSDTRVDGRNTEIEITMAGPAPIAIYSEGEDVSLTPPAAGYKVDAIVIDGKIEPDAAIAELGLEHSVAEDTKEARAAGTVKGGGPTITVRATRGDLTLRTRNK